jgi:hypothetical protein
MTTKTEPKPDGQLFPVLINHRQLLVKAKTEREDLQARYDRNLQNWQSLSDRANKLPPETKKLIDRSLQPIKENLTDLAALKADILGTDNIPAELRRPPKPKPADTSRIFTTRLRCQTFPGEVLPPKPKRKSAREQEAANPDQNKAKANSTQDEESDSDVDPSSNGEDPSSDTED